MIFLLTAKWPVSFDISISIRLSHSWPGTLTNSWCSCFTTLKAPGFRYAVRLLRIGVPSIFPLLLACTRSRTSPPTSVFFDAGFKPGMWKQKRWKRSFFCGSRSAKNPPLLLPHRREEWREKRNWFCYPL